MSTALETEAPGTEATAWPMPYLETMSAYPNVTSGGTEARRDDGRAADGAAVKAEVACRLRPLVAPTTPHDDNGHDGSCPYDNDDDATQSGDWIRCSSVVADEADDVGPPPAADAASLVAPAAAREHPRNGAPPPSPPARRRRLMPLETGSITHGNRRHTVDQQHEPSPRGLMEAAAAATPQADYISFTAAGVRSEPVVTPARHAGSNGPPSPRSLLVAAIGEKMLAKELGLGPLRAVPGRHSNGFLFRSQSFADDVYDVFDTQAYRAIFPNHQQTAAERKRTRRQAERDKEGQENRAAGQQLPPAALDPAAGKAQRRRRGGRSK